MQHRPQSTYRNSGLARTKVKQNKFVAFFSRVFMQPSEIGLVEDRSNSTTIIRIIVGLLLVHLIIIGGIILHGKVDNTIPAEATTLASPPAMPKAPAADTVITTNTLPQTAPAPTPGPTANPTQHITQAPGASTATTSVATTTTPVNKPVNTTPKQGSYKVVKVKPGDTLTKIAEENNVSTAAILAINDIKNPNVLTPNHAIRIPLAAGSDEAKKAAADAEEEKRMKEGIPYKVKRGDTLSRLATKFGTKVDEIKKLNNKKNDNLKENETLKIPYTEKSRKELLKNK